MAFERDIMNVKHSRNGRNMTATWALGTLRRSGLVWLNMTVQHSRFEYSMTVKHSGPGRSMAMTHPRLDRAMTAQHARNRPQRRHIVEHSRLRRIMIVKRFPGRSMAAEHIRLDRATTAKHSRPGRSTAASCSTPDFTAA